MGEVVLKVENLSKIYRLGEVGTGTISHDLNRWWAKMRGKEDPTSLIGQENDRSKAATSDFVYALNDVSFEVKQGEVLGIIGKNGAGKSTLLKLISKITAPTKGSIKAKGRIASLLEVGTGMHPEMTARENIYLNGAILGMQKWEIKKKFDEIIDFAGCRMYVDTPVKRFSSGMRVRLGFAVAAFLEPEILIVDEVLAVGDAEFQKKAIGKMKDVSSSGGRTVLFVSHNMKSIKNLCENSILLDKGQISFIGKTDKTIEKYFNSSITINSKPEVNYKYQEGKRFQISKIRLLDSELKTKSTFNSNEKIILQISYLFNENVAKTNLTVVIKNGEGEIVFFIDQADSKLSYFNAKIGLYTFQLEIPNPLLKDGEYFLSFGMSDIDSNINDHKFDCLKLIIENNNQLRNTRNGVIFKPLNWKIIENNS